MEDKPRVKLKTSKQGSTEKQHPCELCEKTYKNKQSLQRHLLWHKNARAWPCEVCGKKFTQKCHQNRHTKLHDRPGSTIKSVNHSDTSASKKRHSCPICKQFYADRHSLNRHLLLHENKRPWACDMCGKRFTQKSHRDRHTKIHEKTTLKDKSRHGDENTPDTSLSDILTEKRKLEKNAAKSESKKKHPCHLCTKTYAEKYNLKTHLLWHENKVAWTCDTCGKGFIKKFHRDRHMKIHKKPAVEEQQENKPKPEACKYCNRLFTTKSNLNIHLQKHLGWSYSCEKCDKTFTTKDSLKIHLLLHNSVLPWICEVCGAQFQTRFKLLRHRKIHAVNKAVTCICDICGKGFSEKANLITHQQRVHSEERPFQCQTCGQLFKSASSLRDHDQVHKRIKPFKCPTCFREFRQKKTLQRHMELHKNQSLRSRKAFILPQTLFCDLCGNGFTDKNNLLKHKRKHREGTLKIFNKLNNRDFVKVKNDSLKGRNRRRVKVILQELGMETENANHQQLDHVARKEDEVETVTGGQVRESDDTENENGVVENRDLNGSSSVLSDNVPVSKQHQFDIGPMSNQHLNVALTLGQCQTNGGVGSSVNEQMTKDKDIAVSRDVTDVHEDLDYAANAKLDIVLSTNETRDHEVCKSRDKSKSSETESDVVRNNMESGKNSDLETSIGMQISETENDPIKTSKSHGPLFTSQNVINLSEVSHATDKNTVISDYIKVAADDVEITVDDGDDENDVRVDKIDGRMNETEDALAYTDGHIEIINDADINTTACDKDSHVLDKGSDAEELVIDTGEKQHLENSSVDNDSHILVPKERTHDNQITKERIHNNQSIYCPSAETNRYDDTLIQAQPSCRVFTKTLHDGSACIKGTQTRYLRSMVRKNNVRNNDENESRSKSNLTCPTVDKEVRKSEADKQTVEKLGNSVSESLDSARTNIKNSEESLIDKCNAMDKSGQTVSGKNKNIALDKSSTETKHICNVCNKTFKHHSYLRKHVRNIHSDMDIVYKCNQINCSKTFSSLSKLHSHFTEHPVKTCALCGEQFNHINKMIGHVLGSHETIGVIKRDMVICMVCGILCKSDSSALKHITEHLVSKLNDEPSRDQLIPKLNDHNSQYYKSVCDHNPGAKSATNYTTSTVYEVDRDIRNTGKACETISHFSCEIISQPRCETISHPRCETISHPRCEIVSQLRCETVSQNLTIHQEISKNLLVPDSGKMRLACDLCGKRFTHGGHLRRHIRANACSANYVCNHCDQKFHTKGQLRVHKTLQHGIKAYECPSCQKSFRTSSGLRKHKKFHMNDTSELAYIRPFMCSICGKQYTTASSLKTHMISHTNTRPFRCDRCESTYVQRSHLLRHIMVVHMGIRKFKCDAPSCSKSFQDKRSLMIHKRCHTRERPFHCAKCGHQFSQKQNLIAHTKTHSKMKGYECMVCRRQLSSKLSLMRHMDRHEMNLNYSPHEK